MWSLSSHQRCRNCLPFCKNWIYLDFSAFLFFICKSLSFGYLVDCKTYFEDSKEVIRIRKSKKFRQYNGQMKKEKHRFTKYFTEDRATRTLLYTGRGECIQVIRRGKQFLLHLWHPWCYSWYPVMQKGPNHGGHVKLSKWRMQLNTCKVMLVSDIYQFAKKRNKCTLIILIKT